MPQVFANPRTVGHVSGSVAPSSVLGFYQTGTSTPQAVYTDAALTEGVTSITADSAGVFAKVYLNPGAAAKYRVTLEDSTGSVQWTEDDIDHKLDITNAASSGTLAVTGATTLTGAVSAASTLGVTGAVTLSSTLAVTGASVLSGPLSVGGAAGFADNVAIEGITTLTGALSQDRSTVTYSASMTPVASNGTYFDITATNSTAFTINAPTGPTSGQRITITIKNTSGGALGTATWDAVFKMDTWTNPATAFGRSIDFVYDATNWREVSRTTADIPN